MRMCMETMRAVLDRSDRCVSVKQDRGDAEGDIAGGMCMALLRQFEYSNEMHALLHACGRVGQCSRADCMVSCRSDVLCVPSPQLV